MSHDRGWTPFVVPWTWYQAKRFLWRCPQALLVSCVVDDLHDASPPLAAVMHRDKQLGFTARLNDMKQLLPFLGLHLVDVARTDPSTPSNITFLLTKGRCPCERRQGPQPLPAPQAQQRQPQPLLSSDQQQEPHPARAASGISAGVAGGGGGGISASNGGRNGPRAAEWLGSYAPAGQAVSKDGADRGFDKSCGAPRGDGSGGVSSGYDTDGLGPGTGDEKAGSRDNLANSGLNGRDHISDDGASDSSGGSSDEDAYGGCGARGCSRRGGSTEDEKNDGVRGANGGGCSSGRGRGRRRKGFNGGRTHAAVVEESGRPAARQCLCRCPCHVRSLTQVLVSQSDVEDMEEEWAERPYRKEQTRVDPECAAASRRPLPRMTPSTLEGLTSLRTVTGATTAHTTSAMASGSHLVAAAAVTAGCGQPPPPPAGAGYRFLQVSCCYAPVNSKYVSTNNQVVAAVGSAVDMVRVIVEVDGVLPPPDEAPFRCRLYSHKSGHRLMPTPTPAVGRLCVGWGLLSDGVIVLQVMSRREGHEARGRRRLVPGKRRATADGEAGQELGGDSEDGGFIEEVEVEEGGEEESSDVEVDMQSEGPAI